MIVIDQALARRLEDASALGTARYAEALGRLRPSSQSAVVQVAGAQVIYAGPGSPVNRAIGAGLHGPLSDADLDTITAFYAERGEPARIDLCPLADPTLTAQLKERGYRLEHLYNVLVRQLTEELVSPASPADVTVSQAGPDELDVWIETVAQGFADSGPATAEMLAVIAPNAHSAVSTCFLARVNGQPAGGGAIYVQNGIAELGSGSTLADFRRRGVHSALLWQRLVAARDIGCDMAKVLTAPGAASQRNIMRAGFQLAYVKATLVG